MTRPAQTIMIIPSEDNVSRDEILQIMVSATITNTGLG